MWTYHRSPQDLKHNRIVVLNRFLDEYDRGTEEGRYVVGGLPSLGMKDDQFDIALCSHFLFLYSEHLTYQFHRDSVYDMLRVAREVRIFPLMTLHLEKSPHLAKLIEELRNDGYSPVIETVDYELQRGGDEMLRITRPGYKNS